MASVVVVGAGVGGLAAAARLAALGHEVTICEQAERVGGKVGGLERAGYRFDTGPSLLTLPQDLAELFAATGDPMETVLTLEPVDPVARYRFPDGVRLDMPRTLQERCAALDAALGPGAGDDWARLARRAEAIWEAVEEPFLGRPVSARRLLRHAVRLRDLHTVAPWRTLRGLGRQHLRDPRLRLLLERYATYTGSDPRRAPAALAAIAHLEQAFGAWHVRGGLQRIPAALAERAVALGAHLRVGADVIAVTRQAERVDGVRLASGERLAADVVVANADAAHLYGDLVAAPRVVRRQLTRATPSLSGFAILLGLRGPTADRAHHTVLFPPCYDDEFDAIFGADPRPVVDPTIYIAAPDDPTMHPPDGEAWFVLVNAPRHGPVDWDAPGLAETYADEVLERLAARGLEVRDRVAVRAIRTPADLARDTRAVGGAIYGTASNSRRAAFLRPSNRSPIRGLYLVGGSAHPGGGLPLVVRSARIVADLIGPP